MTWLTRPGSLEAQDVDLAWLRSTPWRERVAAAFDSPRRRPDLKAISAVTVRHREDSLASGVLFCGWAAPWSLVILAAEGAATYCLGRAMDRPGARKKLLLWTGAGLVLAVLLLFKYTGFFLARWTAGLPGWLVPLGLSWLLYGSG